MFCCFIVTLLIRGDWVFLSQLFCHSLCIIWVPGLICDLFSRPVLWDSICFMKKGQVGSLNLNWNCLDIVLALGWVMPSGSGVVFSLPISLGYFFSIFSFCYHHFCIFLFFGVLDISLYFVRDFVFHYLICSRFTVISVNRGLSENPFICKKNNN